MYNSSAIYESRILFIDLDERLFENWATIRAENLQLSMQVERGFHDRGGSGHSEEREKVLIEQQK